MFQKMQLALMLWLGSGDGNIDYLAKMEYGFQRLVFIYETLCEMEIDLFRGNTVEILLEQARRVGADTIRVPESPNPTIQANIEALRYTLKVEVVPDEPFVHFERPPNLQPSDH